jgi:hypothetical protein
MRPVTRVLVVDDEAPIRRAMRANLVARGYEGDLADAGEVALLPSTWWSTVRWNGWKTRIRSAGAIPGPVSMMRRSIQEAPSRTTAPARNHTRCPDEVWRTALLNRLASARSSRSGSASASGRSSGTSTSIS